MDVRIGTLNSRLTVTESGDLLERPALDRIVRLVTQRVLQELDRRERRRGERVDRRRIDPERY